MDQARNLLVNESDTTATKSINIAIPDAAAATNSIEAESSTSSTHTNAASTNGTNIKKARLRKGKWTIEEEEYTSRIIQYFSTGLLILPNGATLRSYLADKLNCDPMRITKKFTGACCLGRRAYHLRDRPRASSAEVEMANFELLHLERRFWLRVEHEQTGLPLPPWHELLASQPPPPAALVSADVLPSLFSLQQQGAATPVVNANNIPWIQHNSAIPPKLASLVPSYPAFNLNIQSNANTSSLPLAAAGQLLLGNSNERAHIGNPSSALSPLPQLQVLNNIIASLALSQALNNQHAQQLQPHGSNMFLSNNAVAAPKSTTTTSSIYDAPTNTFSPANSTVNSTNKTAITIPVLSSQEQHSKQVQLYQKELEKTKVNSSAVPGSSLKKEERTKQLKAAFEEQQRALRLAYEKSLRDAQEQERNEQLVFSDSATITSESKGKATTVNISCNSSNSKFIPDATSPAEQLERSYEAHLESLRRDEQQSSIEASPKLPPTTSASTYLVPRTENVENKCEIQMNKKEEQPRQKTTDEEAGTILLGFLNSLRESFEDAVEDKNASNTIEGAHNYNNKNEKVAATKLILTANDNIKTSTMVTGVSSDLSSRNHMKRNGNNHAHSQISAANVRRQSSDPITSLSHFQTSKRKTKPASVTETSSSTSSQPTIEQSSSSQEDSKSDKMGNSSSEESSEKETMASRRTSKGPPRKRLKGFHEPHEFTRENLMAHSKRMDMECEESGCSSSSSDE
mmetsp:Transcript_63849/g.71464  ORF Transcript_63849/g.71464 Transcript_63849/m.71464 type:complete len:743 (-) Transcript_63849:1802-4030(-)